MILLWYQKVLMSLRVLLSHEKIEIILKRLASQLGNSACEECGFRPVTSAPKSSSFTRFLYSVRALGGPPDHFKQELENHWPVIFKFCLKLGWSMPWWPGPRA